MEEQFVLSIVIGMRGTDVFDVLALAIDDEILWIGIAVIQIYEWLSEDLLWREVEVVTRLD